MFEFLKIRYECTIRLKHLEEAFANQTVCSEPLQSKLWELFALSVTERLCRLWRIFLFAN